MDVLDRMLRSLRAASALPRREHGTIEDLARIDEAAYPWRDRSLERALLGSRYRDSLRVHVAEGASALAVLDCEGAEDG